MPYYKYSNISYELWKRYAQMNPLQADSLPIMLLFLKLLMLLTPWQNNMINKHRSLLQDRGPRTLYERVAMPHRRPSGLDWLTQHRGSADETGSANCTWLLAATFTSLLLHSCMSLAWRTAPKSLAINLHVSKTLYLFMAQNRDYQLTCSVN